MRIALRESAPEWHLFGLIVTEVKLLACFFNEVEHRLGRQLQPGDFLGRPDWRAALDRFFSLKMEWPFRPGEAPGPANYFFEDGLYRCPPVSYPEGRAVMSPFNDIFRSLRSSFHSHADLQEAEHIIERLLTPFTCQPGNVDTLIRLMG